MWVWPTTTSESSLVAQRLKNPSAMQKHQETQVRFLGWDDPLEEEMVTNPRTLAWRITLTRSLAGYSIAKNQTQWKWLSTDTHTTTTSSLTDVIHAFLTWTITTQRWLIVFFSESSPLSLSTLNYGWDHWERDTLFQKELLSWKNISLELLLTSFSKTWGKSAWEIKMEKQSWKMVRHWFLIAPFETFIQL